jgi:anti-anti-sigma factor
MDELTADRPMTFAISGAGTPTLTVTIRGELDIAGVAELQQAVGPRLEGSDRLVLELGGLSFADSSAIALWVRWSATVAEMELRNVKPLLSRVISSMGLAARWGVDP